MYEFILWVLFGVFTVTAIPFFGILLMKEKDLKDAGVNLGRKE